ncbi:hypothetical protein Pmani_030506 [Petrolisthes manimaculis]|uniref:Gamma-tubulin complex component n=1 Tax=Petrolisthes manimaculis TaxID=1843537 RepID=A0AAE1NX90_9EUCA|nr:hypothetical protein Pmani_030506 [Petrolisthes manimaculis]
MDASNTLLKRLCGHVTGASQDGLATHFQLALQLLNEAPTGGRLDDHNVVADKIKRRLIGEKRLEDAARFASLMNRLQKSAVLRNKTSILAFFFALTQDSGGPKIENGICLGPSEADLFPLPRLYHQPYQEPTATSTSSSVPQESVVSHVQSHSQSHSPQPSSPSTRVSRLAAMYTGSGGLPVERRQPGSQSQSPTTERRPFVPPLPKHTTTKEAMVEVTEKVLIRELLFVFQGIEGKIIKMDANKDGYKLDPKVRLSGSQREMILKLAELGWLYIQVKNFCEWGSGSMEHRCDVASGGLVSQSLVLALREELSEYCRLIAVLEAQNQDGGDTPVSESGGGLTLRRLVLWTLEPRTRLRILAFLTHAARTLSGGACVSAIYQHLHHGDAAHRGVVRRVLSKACTPLYLTLTQWLLDGTLQDPHHEFFIAADPTVADDRLWQDKYSIRWGMLPSFISKTQAEQVLASGKSLNFLRNVCQFRAPISGRDAIKAALQQTTVESLFSQDESNQLDHLLGLTFRETSRHVLEEILNRHQLMSHLRALRRYLLLEQGHFIHYLMKILSPELCKPASNLYPHNLSSLLETAVAATNAQYEDPDVLRRLDVRLLEISPGDLGWDVFSLDYHVDGAIGTVFTGECMRQYLMLFNALWKDKRMEMILADIWKEQSATSKLCRDLPEMRGVLHRVQLLTQDMVHLVHQMEYYMTFEVLECSWHDLTTKLQTAESLDHIISAHNQFLHRIVAGALLDAESKDVRTHLRTFYNLIQNLRGLQEQLSLAVSAEVNARKAAETEIKARTAAGDFGTSAEREEIERKRRKEFTTSVLPKLKSDLRINDQTYQDMVQSFLLMLAQQDDQKLHLLSTRLDFNEYYHRRDHRLNQRLTYHHKRKSMGASTFQG